MRILKFPDSLFDPCDLGIIPSLPTSKLEHVELSVLDPKVTQPMSELGLNPPMFSRLELYSTILNRSQYLHHRARQEGVSPILKNVSESCLMKLT